MSRPLRGKTGYDKKKTIEDTVSELRRSWGSLVLMSTCFLSALGIVIVGGLGVLPRFLVGLAMALIIMSLIFLLRLQWFAQGRGRGWILLIPGSLVFAIICKVPQGLIPFQPMSLIDMIQLPFTLNSVLVGLLVVLGFGLGVAYLAKSRR